MFIWQYKDTLLKQTSGFYHDLSFTYLNSDVHLFYILDDL